MPATLAELCSVLEKHGMPCELHGDGAATIQGVATLEDARAGEISFLSNPKYERKLRETAASAVVVKPGIATPDGVHRIETADPYAAITACIVTLHGYREHPKPRAGGVNAAHAYIAETATIGERTIVHHGATVEDGATLGDDCVLYPGAYVGRDVKVGNNCVLHPNVVIYDRCVLGDRVTIHAGTVIGNDGLGYAPVRGKWVKIPQIGIVEIGDDVELGSNCSIDRATLGKTVIARGTKFSNLIAIGHGTQVGEDCMFVAQTGLAGSVQVGRHVTIAGQVGVVGHIKIGDNVTIGAKAGVINDIPDGETYLGQPAMPINETKRRLAYVQKLPELVKQVKELQRQVAELRGK